MGVLHYFNYATAYMLSGRWREVLPLALAKAIVPKALVVLSRDKKLRRRVQPQAAMLRGSCGQTATASDNGLVREAISHGGWGVPTSKEVIAFMRLVGNETRQAAQT